MRGPIRCRRLEVAPSRDRSHQPTAFDSVDVGGRRVRLLWSRLGTAGYLEGNSSSCILNPSNGPVTETNGSATLDFGT